MAKTKSKHKSKPKSKPKPKPIRSKQKKQAKTHSKQRKVKRKEIKIKPKIVIKRPKPARTAPVTEDYQRVSVSRQAFLEKDSIKKEEKEKTLFHKYFAQIIGCIVALYIIIYMFAPPGWTSYFDVVFFSALLIIGLIIADFFYRHEHKPHDAAIIAGLFFLPPLLTAVLFNKFWCWVIFALMTWALASALIVYYHHGKGRHLTDVMWVSAYSHLLAFSAAIVLFSLLSYIHPVRFLSEISIILTYSIPPIFVHFFISHYMYVHHFNPKHPLHDAIVGLKYALWFTFLLVIVIAAADMGVNAKSFRDMGDDYAESLKFDLDTISGVYNSLDRAPDYLKELPVHQEVRAYVWDVQSSILMNELALASRRISLINFLDDSYLDLELEMWRNDIGRYLTREEIMQAKEVLDKADPTSAWTRFTIEDVASAYSVRAVLPGYDAVKVAIYSERISPSELNDDVLPAIDSLMKNQQSLLSELLPNAFLFGGSYFFQRVNAVMMYSKLYLFTARHTFFILVETPYMKSNMELWTGLVRNIDTDEPVSSKQLRYELLMMAGERQQNYLNPTTE
ncbi:MAG: hypothetical protein KJ574_04890 [Nanoarchaeota archaeon]|nr:hypothetical protein [Nanoarchaeota archaeon]